jgi:UDP-3-O-[3-hydroxymyristoyl] glucosamine N-acyltransferase
VTPPVKTLADLAREVGGKIIGDGRVQIWRVASIEEAGPGEITFLANPSYFFHLAHCRAGAVIVAPGVVAPESARRQSKNYIEVSDPYFAFAKIHQMFNPAPQGSPHVSPFAYIDSAATLAQDLTIFPHVFISRGARVGARTILYPGVFLGEGVEIGDDCELHPNVVVRYGCKIGNRVILHAGAVIGSDGFGYAGHSGERVKIPQAGIVEVHDDVEIGANTTVDRATFGRTVIGRGAKLDNLVQIAHNVRIGAHTVMAAMSGAAGSTRIGQRCKFGGGVVVANQLTVCDDVTLLFRSSVTKSITEPGVYGGCLPAEEATRWRRTTARVRNLDTMAERLQALEKKVESRLKPLPQRDRGDEKPRPAKRAKPRKRRIADEKRK